MFLGVSSKHSLFLDKHAKTKKENEISSEIENSSNYSDESKSVLKAKGSWRFHIEMRKA